MKRLAAFLLAFSLALTVSAVPRPRRPPPRHRRPRPAPSPARHLKEVPWQSILAGGAAVSGIVFAYKVADGIQQGTVETARASPESFAEAVAGFGGTVRVVAALVVTAGAGYLAWRLARRRDRPQPDQPPRPASDPDEPLKVHGGTADT